jgi:hypothetical protein
MIRFLALCLLCSVAIADMFTDPIYDTPGYENPVIERLYRSGVAIQQEQNALAMGGGSLAFSAVPTETKAIAIAKVYLSAYLGDSVPTHSFEVIKLIRQPVGKDGVWELWQVYAKAGRPPQKIVPYSLLIAKMNGRLVEISSHMPEG